MAAYIGIIHKDPESDYSVSFPDFPGCISAGVTMDEVRAMAAEALEFHVDGLLEDGHDIPAPSSLEDVMTDENNRTGVAILVDLPPKHRPPVRINVTLPPDLIEAIDRVSSNRSRFLADAARRQLQER